MALRFLDSFDHYTTLSQKYGAVSGGTIQAASKRTGANGLLLGNGQYVGVTIDAQGTWIPGVAFRVSALPGAAVQQILSIYDGATPNIQGSIGINIDGTLRLYRGSVAGGVLVVSSTRAILPNVWYFLELRHVIAAAGGTLELRINEEVWATFNGNTQNTGNATANQIYLYGGNQAGLTIDFDDYYILDGTGIAPNNAYWGDTHIEALVPNAAGFYAEWLTLVGAATHWQANNEVPPDEDVSYVADAVLNSRDTYNLGNLSIASATINGIQTIIRARKTDAGAASIARLLRTAALDFQGADVALGVSYAYILEQIALNPNTGIAWTVADINALEAGARVR